MNYIHPSVSRKAIDNYFRGILAAGFELHSLVVRHNNKTVVRYAPAPYDCTTKGEVYSVSKTFASTCIGIAQDMGILNVNEKLVDMFPDKLPDEVSDNLKEITIRHVLCMDSGHDRCVMPFIFREADPVKAYLAQPVPQKPGTFYQYNTGNTCMLSLILQHKTGKTMYDFAEEHLFRPLGIENARWNAIPSGATEAGIGCQISTEDMAVLMQMFLNGGTWNGKRIVSEAWIQEATKFQSNSGRYNTQSDWIQGYGYQLWRCTDGYRADGAFSQLSVVFPEKNMVVSVKAKGSSAQVEMDLLREFSEHLYDEDEQVELFSAYPTLPHTAAKIPFADKIFYCDKNGCGITTISLRKDGDKLSFTFSDGTKSQSVWAGNGAWEESTVVAANLKPKLLGLHCNDRPEILTIAACYTVENGEVVFSWRHKSCENPETVRVSFDGTTLRVSFTSHFPLIEKRKSELVAR